MNILIPDSWLREYLKTKATPKQITEYLSLCGPSVERVTEVGTDHVYDIEVTTNRVDTMSIYGIARELAAILPQFGIKASLRPLNLKKITNKKPLGITILDDPKLNHRILAIKLSDVVQKDSPKWMKDKLEKVGQRPLTNLIDITNYVMWEVGHPIHVFDYDKMTSKKIVVREAKKGEILTTLDNKTLELSGGEIVFDNGAGEIIDLPGIMGTKNTVVGPETKNVLLWIESIDPVKIRRASMNLAIRTQAAVLNEKSVDPELGLTAILRGVELFQKVAGAKVASKLIDIYHTPYKTKRVITTQEFITERLGIELPKNKISAMLTALEFKTVWKGNKLEVSIPSFRSRDVELPEDIVEEVARIYGYHNLRGELMAGKLPEVPFDRTFEIEEKIKQALKECGGSEVYTLSLVGEALVNKDHAIKIKNPLGGDTEYLRTSLIPQLTLAADDNTREEDPYFLFEMAHVYTAQKDKLPVESLKIACIFANYPYRRAMGVAVHLLKKLNIKATQNQEDGQFFVPNRRIVFSVDKSIIGYLGLLEGGYWYCEFAVAKLIENARQTNTYKPIPKYPAQVEDLTFIIPDKTHLGDVIASIGKVDKNITYATLTDTYKDTATLRVWYQSNVKTLDNSEVRSLREKIVSDVNKKFGAKLKD